MRIAPRFDASPWDYEQAMPLTLERPSLATRQTSDPRECVMRPGAPKPIVVGLVNNMPDGALAATERQFIQILEEAGADYDVRLRLYALEGVARSQEARRAMQERYHSSGSLCSSWHDGLIVTGTEPRAPSLSEEAYWHELVGVFEWARARTRSTLFSCLAAHAAVFHWNGIARMPLARKLSGVFAARVTQQHPLVDGLPTVFTIPHSRLNGLDELALASNGYETLIRSDESGVNVFVKDQGSLLVFLQGHPEYEADTLAKEFRRDLKRYLAGAREAPPDPPANYYAPAVLADVKALIERARLDRRPELAECLAPAALNGSRAATWRSHSRRFYRNWMAIIAKRQAEFERVVHHQHAPAAMAIPGNAEWFAGPLC